MRAQIRPFRKKVRDVQSFQRGVQNAAPCLRVTGDNGDFTKIDSFLFQAENLQHCCFRLRVDVRGTDQA